MKSRPREEKSKTGGMAEEDAAFSTQSDAVSTSLFPYRYNLAFGFFNSMCWMIAIGPPMILLLEHFEASAFLVGFAYSCVIILLPVQVLATSLLPILGFKRQMMLGWGIRALWLIIPLVLALRSPEKIEP